MILSDTNLAQTELEVVDAMLTALATYDASITMDRAKARELAAILNHFADTGELPGEVGDGQ